MTTPAQRQNLVLGCATGYTPEQLLPFVSSLRGSGFEGELALVIYEDQRGALASLAGQYSVNLIAISRTPAWLPKRVGCRVQNRGRMRWLHKCLGGTLPPLLRSGAILSFLGWHVHYFFHISCGRYFLYYSYLRRRRGDYNVLLTDVRDVIFQDDPFRYSPGDGLHYFMDPTVCIGDEPLNAEWVTLAFGEAYCASRKGSRISCAGTTMGPLAPMMTYLQGMCIELMRAVASIAGLFGVDQAVHNYLLWEGKLPGVVLCENGRDAVMTLKNADIKMHGMDGESRILNMDGHPAPVLHQYDFHPILAARFKHEGG
jgi:hypothetical protein